ncbi:MAG: hypothetical protein LBL08_02110 [Candidatus Nomurabacteria bacterium]|nr:hypothetical protein [Candidatus Nomurabacteria bacterium]
MDNQKPAIPTNKARKSWSVGKILAVAIGTPTVVIGLLAAAFLTNTFTPQWFMDRVTVQNYQPSEVIAQTVERSGMNEHGRFMFYTAEPQIDEREAFNQHCAEVMNEIANVLGCYDGRIYLFDITDQRIAGVEDVTAAHEMLHAAYDRLGILEQIRVNQLIRSELNTTTNQTVRDAVELYSQTEPGQEINELHSILGTEVRDLSPELAEYYSRYFADRDKVLTANEKYNAVFDKMQQRADELEGLLGDLETEINSLSSSYDAAAGQLSRDIDSFNSRADSGSFTSESSFYAERSGLLRRQNQLSTQLNKVNAKIDEYNKYVKEVQALGRDSEGLQKNMSSQEKIE